MSPCALIHMMDGEVDDPAFFSVDQLLGLVVNRSPCILVRMKDGDVDDPSFFSVDKLLGCFKATRRQRKLERRNGRVSRITRSNYYNAEL